VITAATLRVGQRSDIDIMSPWQAIEIVFAKGERIRARSTNDCLAVACPGLDVIVVDAEICPTCGRGNNCGMAKGETTCWCFAMAHVLPVRATKDGGRCYCRECLTRVISERAERAAKVELRAGNAD